MGRIGATGSRREPNDTVGTVHYHAQALTRGLGLLEEIAAATGPLTLSDFHERTGLPRSTLVRLLSVLDQGEYVVRIDDRPAFRLGHKVLALSDAYMSLIDISHAAASCITELALATGQTGNLGVLDGDEVMHVCVQEANRQLRFASTTGQRDSAYAAGLGKVLLAALDEDEVVRRVPPEPFPAVTDRTITTLHALLKDLRVTARRGYGLDDNESCVGLRCLAVPVIVGGEVLAAVSISGPAAEFGPERQNQHLALLGKASAALAADADVVAALRHLAGTLRTDTR